MTAAWQVFGLEGVDVSTLSTAGLAVEPPRQGSDLSARLCNVVAWLRSQHTSSPPCFVVVQGARHCCCIA